MSSVNTRYWERLSQTPVSATRPYKSSGTGLTEIKPQYIKEKLTEVFGPCGIGWGWTIEKSTYITVPTVAKPEDGYHTCEISLWYREPEGVIGRIVGLGHTALYGKYGVASDIEKASETDALSRAARCLGIAADVLSIDGWDRDAAIVQEELDGLRVELEATQTKKEFEEVISRLSMKQKVALQIFVGDLRLKRGWHKS